jgi:hypothetical protein
VRIIWEEVAASSLGKVSADEYTRFHLQGWRNKPGLGEVLPETERKVADVEWFGGYLERDITRYFAARCRGTREPFVDRDCVW